MSIAGALPENELMTTGQSFDLALSGGTGDLCRLSVRDGFNWNDEA